MRHPALLLSVLSLSLAACVAGAGDEGGSDLDGDGKADGAGSGSGATHKLPGYDETLMVGSVEGKLAIVHVGDTFSKKSVTLSTSLSPNVIHARGGKFYVLLDSGKLAIVDAKTAKVERTLAVGTKPQDVEWLSDTQIAVSTGATVVTYDLASGNKVATLDLSSLKVGTGKVQTRRMLRLDDKLFVQVARTGADGRPANGALAVVQAGALAKTIELDGLNPDFDLVHDTRRGHLYVSCAGVRPSNTGVLVRIDTNTLAVHDRIPAESGWQGIVQFADPFETLFMIYHTSTPTTSSHLFSFPVDDAGAIGDSGHPTIVDAFDGLDALSMNAEGSLVAMANHCAVGFCIGGAGVNFVDTMTEQKQEKLMAAQIGFEPVIVAFSR